MTLLISCHQKKMRSGFSVFCACMIMVILLLRAFVPVGFMPDLNGGQPFKMVICSIDGPKTVLVDKDFNLYKDSETHHDQSVKGPGDLCVFSVNAAFTDIVLPEIILSSQAFYRQLLLTAFYEPTVHWRFFGNASSTSPPHFFCA